MYELLGSAARWMLLKERCASSERDKASHETFMSHGATAISTL